MTPPSLHVATPCYGGQTTDRYTLAMIELGLACMKERVQFSYSTLSNESLIDRARNRLAHWFLKTDATHLLFIDADIGFRSQDILAMLRTGYPIVGGAYPKKAYRWDYVAHEARRNPHKYRAFKNSDELAKHGAHFVISHLDGVDTQLVERGCISVSEAGTGCLLIEREVFLRMIDEGATLYFDDSSLTEQEPMFSLFETPVVDARKLSEDYYFCLRARQLGYPIRLFLGAQLTHTGAHTWHGDVGVEMEDAPAPKGAEA